MSNQNQNLISLTVEQQQILRKKFIDAGLKARVDFLQANPDYQDKTLDFDDLEIIKSIGNCDEKLALLRGQYLASGRDLFTIDRQTIKSEVGIPEDDKYKMTPWLFVKQSRSDKVMYQKPGVPASLTRNEFLDANGNEHQVLRAKRIFQLASQQEIVDFAAQVGITLDLFLQLML